MICDNCIYDRYFSGNYYEPPERYCDIDEYDETYELNNYCPYCSTNNEEDDYSEDYWIDLKINQGKYKNFS